MSWSTSKVFAYTVHDLIEAGVITGWNLTTNTPKVALYNDSITPDATVASASTAYGAGVWTAGSSPNLQDSTSGNAGWPYAGRPIVSPVSTVTSNVYKYDVDDTQSADSHTTITAAYGCQVYNDTISSPVADQGISFHYFGGSQTVTEGTFVVAWNSSGVFTATV